MSSYKDYMNDPDIVNEPMPMREVHAIRLMIGDETKNMTPQEKAEYYNKNAQEALAAHGIKVTSPRPATKAATG